MSVLSTHHFHDEAAAFAYVEAKFWPKGPVCPKCGEVDNAVHLKGLRTKPSKKNPNGILRHGVYQCRGCRKQFTVRVGTVFESSHIPLRKWLQAIYLLAKSKKGISSNDLARTLEISLKAGWFLSHRIREAMRDDSAANFGKDGGVVMADETFFGNIPGEPVQRGYRHKNKILTLIDVTSGRAKSIVVEDLTAENLTPILKENIAAEAKIYTDDARHYASLGEHFADHQTVRHSRYEYVRGEVTTNQIEGFFGIFKRGMRGIYQHCSRRHLHRLAAEFDFRYSHRIARGIDDVQRAENILLGARGKRLRYR